MLMPDIMTVSKSVNPITVDDNADFEIPGFDDEIDAIFADDLLLEGFSSSDQDSSSSVSPSSDNNICNTFSSSDAHQSSNPYNFVIVLHDLVSDETTNNAIQWLPCGRLFFIEDREDFSTKIIPKYFPTGRGGGASATKFSSFTRRLKRWGFVRISHGNDVGAYCHENFIRGELELAKTIEYPGAAADKNKISKKPSQPHTNKEKTASKKSPPQLLKKRKKHSRRRSSTGSVPQGFDISSIKSGAIPISTKCYDGPTSDTIGLLQPTVHTSYAFDSELSSGPSKKVLPYRKQLSTGSAPKGLANLTTVDITPLPFPPLQHVACQKKEKGRSNYRKLASTGTIPKKTFSIQDLDSFDLPDLPMQEETYSTNEERNFHRRDSACCGRLASTGSIKKTFDISSLDILPPLPLAEACNNGKEMQSFRQDSYVPFKKPKQTFGIANMEAFALPQPPMLACNKGEKSSRRGSAFRRLSSTGSAPIQTKKGLRRRSTVDATSNLFQPEDDTLPLPVRKRSQSQDELTDMHNWLFDGGFWEKGARCVDGAMDDRDAILQPSIAKTNEEKISPYVKTPSSSGSPSLPAEEPASLAPVPSTCVSSSGFSSTGYVYPPPAIAARTASEDTMKQQLMGTMHCPLPRRRVTMSDSPLIMELERKQLLAAQQLPPVDSNSSMFATQLWSANGANSPMWGGEGGIAQT